MLDVRALGASTKSAGPPAAVDVLGCGFDQLVELVRARRSIRGGQGSLAGLEPLVLACGQLVKQASAQGLPRAAVHASAG